MTASAYFTVQAEPVMTPAQLRAALRKSGRRRRLVSLSLFGPLLAFVLVFFVFPIVSFLGLAFQNGEVRSGLPLTSEVLRSWDGRGLPQDAAFAALTKDLEDSSRQEAVSVAASRLNFDVPGFRGLVGTTAAALRADGQQVGPDTAASDAPAGFSIFGNAQDNATTEAATTPATPKERLISIDSRWGETPYWAAIQRGTWQVTSLYILAALDLRVADSGSVEWAPPDRQIYVDLIGRTFFVSAMVTLICVVLGFPVAKFISTQPPNRASLYMFLVLVPLWTSILVRTTAWVVLLQGEGLLNDLIIALGLSDTRLPLIHNRFGVYVAMVHICLPFMILPLYSSMKSTPVTYMRAAASLGASPLRVFLKVYLPLIFPGIAAGALLVFIMALGFYVTPALVGGPRDQMLSYFIATAVNRDLNWGLAAALSLVLLTIVIITMIVLRRFSTSAFAR